ncbi:2-phospho-L-lactate transferase CofD family protein [Bryobacter aggregatus]|uniref:2-phospho-L-lactate transferase CofD family protein n=1 Tax=Bryobacter aggregatus TaxID=360054 RepID=UPI0004E22A03|nr:2-phospho-L-lactate transferase CofD family protein [Bryobacter aggregatus]
MSNSEKSSPKLNITMFSGGSGTHSITAALWRHPQISLKILINAYDDGHSTGRLRRFLPGMLGPSDVRKNLNRLMPEREQCHRSLKKISDHRLPVGIPAAEALALMDMILAGRCTKLPAPLADSFAQLNVAQYHRIQSFLSTFRRYYDEQFEKNNVFNFTDCALGNLFFAGCYLEEGQDFNRTIAAFSVFHDVDPSILLNVTQGENLFLAAMKEDGQLVANEADIVAAQSSNAKISHLYLLSGDTYLDKMERQGILPEEGWEHFLTAQHVTPEISPAAAAAIAEADVIIYGPGTQHSSLLPSYLTRGVGEAVASNRQADKIFVANIHRDLDIPTDDINDLARKFVAAIQRPGPKINVEWEDAVTHFFVQDDHLRTDSAKYIPFDPAQFCYSLKTVRVRDWESQEGRHSGGFVLDEVRQIVQERIDIRIERTSHMVSILIPILNEERTIEEVLKSVVALDFQALGLSKEVLVIDGASTDRSYELAQKVRSVKVLRLDQQQGRGAALRMGIDAARGNLIVFFPGDKEYSTGDLYSLVSSLVNSRFRTVFGSRAVKCINLSGELRSIYQNNLSLYLASKYGGMLLSILTLLIYNRYVTDALSSVKAFDAEFLRSLRLQCDGRDLDTEIVAKLARREEYVLELPVDYTPRSRSAGKKITVFDGLACIWTLIRERFS